MHSDLNVFLFMRRSALAVLIAVFAYGCGPEQSAVRDDFGNSVRAMIAAQTYRPGEDAATLDGGKSLKVMDAYRKDIPKPEKGAKAPIEINIGK